MKKLVLHILLLTTPLCGMAQQDYTIFLTGASFADTANGWFEYGCLELGAKPVNRAVSAESIVDTATKMHLGILYAKDELEAMDAFVIMHVHDRNVYDDEAWPVSENWEDYAFPIDRANYKGAYDYVIKRYISDCYNLRSDPGSKYYGTRAGKAAVIVLCTHWNDARTLYNTSVRSLADKWGLALVEFDRWIGFSKNSPHPVTGEHFSLNFSADRQLMGGEEHGFHPDRGDVYIQKKMAAIFADVMRRVLPLK